MDIMSEREIGRERERGRESGRGKSAIEMVRDSDSDS